MTISDVRANNHKQAFEVVVSDKTFLMPYSRLTPAPSRIDRVQHVYIDDELGCEGFTYSLESGAEGSVHEDSVLDYNADPAYMKNLLLYQLTLTARGCVNDSALSKRHIAERIGTSQSQLERLLDPTNTSKSVDALLVLLGALECDVQVVVTQRPANDRERRIGRAIQDAKRLGKKRCGFDSTAFIRADRDRDGQCY